MSSYGGCLIIFNDAIMARRFQQSVQFSQNFSSYVSRYDINPEQLEVVFLSFDGQNLHSAALAKRGKLDKEHARLLYSDFVSFDPIEFTSVSDHLAELPKESFTGVSAGTGGRCSPELWHDLISIVKSNRPNIAAALDQLEALRQYVRSKISSPSFYTVALERDSVLTALRIFGVETDEDFLNNNFSLTKYQDRENVTDTNDFVPEPFIKGLTTTTLTEEEILDHDVRHFGADWRFIAQHSVGNAHQFKKNGQRLTVRNFNRTRVERSLGVDLVYYHENYKSYVLIQYKRMRDEEYRPISKSYKDEIKRMRNVQKREVALLGQEIGPNSFRMHAGALYFKLCEPELSLEFQSSSLIDGLYFPLEFWDQVIPSVQAKGTQGGTRIRRDIRHFDNTTFIKLIQDGWIGSQVKSTEFITNIIKLALQGKKSVMVATTEGQAPKPDFVGTLF
ncbi:MAG: hypothetical protein AAFU54_11990 [Chloroflexota bacterium]